MLRYKMRPGFHFCRTRQRKVGNPLDGHEWVGPPSVMEWTFDYRMHDEATVRSNECSHPTDRARVRVPHMDRGTPGRIPNNFATQTR